MSNRANMSQIIFRCFRWTPQIRDRDRKEEEGHGYIQLEQFMTAGLVDKDYREPMRAIREIHLHPNIVNTHMYHHKHIRVQVVCEIYQLITQIIRTYRTSAECHRHVLPDYVEVEGRLAIRCWLHLVFLQIGTELTKIMI